ncbi:MAG TPA: flagellar basal body P-ring formation chaperone FlgA [Burkholderiales bacterium]|nr:flagellar basal body P-ring formation chaperone FlgA [Burkholderiales bacterium]
MIGRLLFLVALLLVQHAVQAAEQQARAPIKAAVEAYLARETAGLPGRAAYQVGEIDSQLNVPACRALEAFTPAGTRLWGSTTVGVRCNGSFPWILYVPAEVRVFAEVVHAAGPLAQNQPLTESDLVLQTADLTHLPAGILTDVRSAIGKTVIVSLAAGLPLRGDILRALPVIQQGQAVKLQLQGRGFTVSGEGRALAGAADGQVVPVRVQSGQVVSGLARAGGVVELRP